MDDVSILTVEQLDDMSAREFRGDPRHAEARPIVEAARRGEMPACTAVGILSEVQAALTWSGARPPHAPDVAARAVRLLIEPPSQIRVLPTNLDAAVKMLELAAAHMLTARRIRDARHAAVALAHGASLVYTYDIGDWQAFQADGLRITGPASILSVAA